MAFTFLAAQGVHVGQTVIETDKIDDAAEILRLAEARGVQIVLPRDVMCGSSLQETEQGEGGHTNMGSKVITVPLTRGCCSRESPCVAPDVIGGDIGPETIRLFTEMIEACRCDVIFWNGPMGKYEVDAYSQGTRAIAHALATCTRQGSRTVVGGGDSTAAVDKYGLEHDFTHISTGGGATLEFIEGLHMPGLRALVM